MLWVYPHSPELFELLSHYSAQVGATMYGSWVQFSKKVNSVHKSADLRSFFGMARLI